MYLRYKLINKLLEYNTINNNKLLFLEYVLKNTKRPKKVKKPISENTTVQKTVV